MRKGAYIYVLRSNLICLKPRKCSKSLDTADVGSLSEKDQMRYESALKNYLDTMSCIEYATVKVREEGRAEGEAEAKFSIAKSMKAEGMDVALISRYICLPIEQIEAL